MGPAATTQQLNITVNENTGKWEVNGEAFHADYEYVFSPLPPSFLFPLRPKIKKRK